MVGRKFTIYFVNLNDKIFCKSTEMFFTVSQSPICLRYPLPPPPFPFPLSHPRVSLFFSSVARRLYRKALPLLMNVSETFGLNVRQRATPWGDNKRGVT